jgi:hypothetical protein
MPISFDLKKLKEKYNCVNYFETGLWDPTTNVSSRQALSAGFDNVYCIEIRQEWVELGNDTFKEYIDKGIYHLYLDDSTNMKKYIDNDNFKNKTMFFLDAHVDNINIHNYKKRCPLIEELEAIKSIQRNDNIILIDDLRIIKESFPWGETSYGNIDFLQQIKNFILSININYKFATLNGHVNDDVLLAYI